MPYSLAIEPLLHNIRKKLSAVVFPWGNGCFKIYAYADDVVVFIQSQRDGSIMEDIINNFSVVSPQGSAGLIVRRWQSAEV